MKSRPNTVTSASGFTLIEVMVTIGVLSLLIVMLGQMTGMAASTTINSRKHMDADSQARMIFDRMAIDFSRMVARTDVDCIFHKNAPSATSGVNDAMFFYSEAPAYANVSGNQSTVSLIGYRINPSTFQLERLGEALTWDVATSNDASTSASNTAPGGLISLTYAAGGGIPLAASLLDGNWSKTLGTAANNYMDGADTDYHAIGEQTFRMEMSFLLTDGTLSTLPVANPATSTNFLVASTPPTAADGSPGYSNGSRWYDTTTGRGYICTNAAAGSAVWAPIGARDIAAISVAIAVLDNKSRTIITNPTAAFPAMVAVLPDAVSGTPIAQTWGNSNYWTQTGIPKAATAQIRIYQRYFYLNNR